MKRASLFACASLLGGCVGQPFTPTMEADATLVGGEGIALINKLSEAYEPTNHPFCSYTLPSFQEKSVYSYRRHLKKGSLKVAAFECFKLKDKYRNQEIKEHLEAGYALSNLYCDTFFRRITLRSRTRGFARDTTNDAGAAVSAALALAKAGTAVTGGIGTGFGLIDAVIRNYDTSFLVASDLPALQKAVKTAQSEYRATIDPLQVDSFSNATTIISNYAYYCSFNGMRGLINERLEQGVSPDKVRDYIKKFAADSKAIRDSFEEAGDDGEKAVKDELIANDSETPAPPPP